MEGTHTAAARRIISLLAFAGIVVIFASGLFLGTAPQYVSAAGGVVALAAWGYALVTTIQAKQLDWSIALGIAFVIGLTMALVTLSDNTPDAVSVPQMGGLPIAFIAATYASVGGGAPVLERSLPTFDGAWALLTLVIGGTLVGGAIGTNIGAAAPYITTVGFHLYALAGVLALYAYVVGLIVSYRTGAWGWFVLVLMLPAIGAFMFGLFGPTRADVLMGQEAGRQRRAVGLR
jgi:hypothetical protein